MSSNEIETNDVNGSRLAEQEPSSGRCSRQGNIGRHHVKSLISKRRKWTSQKNKIVMECHLFSEPKNVTGSDIVIVEEERSVEALPHHLGEEVGNVLPKMREEEQADSLDKEEVVIVMEIIEVIERGRKDKLPALRNVPKKKLLEETAKVDNVLS